MAEKKRFVWVDIYKAICIILVVVGHSTGAFNQYIYQFHMAAFFFISGYTSKIYEKNLEDVFISKFRTLILPMLTMILAFLCLRAGKALVFDKIGFAVAARYLVNGICSYIMSGSADYLLGAIWFLPVMFFAFLLSRILSRATGNTWRFLAASVLVYLAGYYLQRRGYRQPHGFDIALIVQLFFALGVVLGQTDFFELLQKSRLRILLYIAAPVWMYILRCIGGSTMDCPSRAYPNIVLTALAPLGGIFFTYFLSRVLERCGSIVQKIFTELGRSTLGILFLHFLFFRAATLILIPFGITNGEDLHSFLLPESAKQYPWAWALYSFITLVCSTVCWKLLLRIPKVGYLLGGKKQKQPIT